MANAFFDPADFHIGDGIVHLAAGGETPFLRSHDAAFHEYVRLKSSGMRGRLRLEEISETLRARMARFLRVGDHEIGFAASVADGVSFLVQNVGFAKDDRVLVARGEFPSLAVPLATAPGLRVVEASNPDRESFEAALHNDDGNGPVRVIVVSYISYIDGRKADIARLRYLADRLNAQLWIDFTQAAGVLPLDMAFADFGFSSCYKWLLGTTGVAVCFWNSKRQPHWRARPSGWSGLSFNGPFANTPERLAPREDAGVFTRGNPAYLPMMILDNALAHFERYDLAALGRHVQGLTVAFINGLLDAGLTPTTPRAPEWHGASICLTHPQAKSIVRELAAEKILAWGGHGRLRFSFHGYNSESDVATALRTLCAGQPAKVQVDV